MALSFVPLDFRSETRFLVRVRALTKTPGFTAIAVLVIAVGIAVNTAVFSVINAVLLKPLTYPNPQELVSLTNTSPGGVFPGASVPKFSLWRQQTSIFQQVATYDFGGAGLNITESDHPQQVQGVHVSADYFAMLGVRCFSTADTTLSGNTV